MRLVLDRPSKASEQMMLIHQKGDDSTQEALSVDKTVLLDQSALKSAELVTGIDANRPEIEIIFTDAGTKRFAQVTRENVGRRLAIVIDGKLCSAPAIRTEIPGGKARISGNFSEAEARDLVSKINRSLRN